MPPKSYFGYVEREADSYVNWADVGRTITNTVDEIDRVRTEKKAAIDAAYKEGLQRINDIPQGENRVLNEFSINLGYNQAENLKIQNNLLKSGKLSPKDFAVYLQNTTDDIDSIYGTLTNAQQVFKEKQDRMKAGANQGIEVIDAIDLEKYGNFADLQTFSNINGKLSFGVTEETIVDGQKVRKVKPGQENILSVDMLVGAMNRKYDRYDYVKDASGFVERLGESIMSYRTLGDRMKAGTITEIVDKTGELDLVKAAEYGITDPVEIDRLKKVVADFKEAEEKYIKASLSEYNMSSIITEELNYEATFDKTLAEKDPKKYMYAERQSNGVIKPMPTPEQEKEAENFMRNQMRQMIDKKLNIKTYIDQAQDKPEKSIPQPTAAQSARLEGIEDVQGSARWIGQLYSGDNKVKQNALEILRNETGVESARFVDMGNGVVGLEISNNQGKTSTIKISDDITVAQFGNAVASAIYTDTENRKVLNRYQNKFDEAITAQHSKFTPMDTADKPDQYWTAVEVKKEDPYILFVNENKKTDENPKGWWGEAFLDMPAENVANKLNDNLKKYGEFRARNTTGYFSEVTVEKLDENGKVISSVKIQPNWGGKNDNKRDNNMQILENFLQDNMINKGGSNSTPKPPKPPKPGG
jgi:hypothetical protein